MERHAHCMFFFLSIQRPILAIADGAFKPYLLRHVPTLETKFWPTFWCVESRAQTVFASLLRQQVLPELKYRRELLTLKDGGEVALDWMDYDCADDSPVVLILPGLTGASQSEYIKCLVTAAGTIGCRVAVFNNRGLGGVPLKVSLISLNSPRTFFKSDLFIAITDTTLVLRC